MNGRDREMFEWVRKFNPYDLYSKSPVPPNADALRPYYEDLIARYLPQTLRFEPAFSRPGFSSLRGEADVVGQIEAESLA